MRSGIILVVLVVFGGLAGSTSYAAQKHQAEAKAVTKSGPTSSGKSGKSTPVWVGGTPGSREGTVGGPAGSGAGSVGGAANQGAKIAGTDIRPKAKH